MGGCCSSSLISGEDGFQDCSLPLSTSERKKRVLRLLTALPADFFLDRLSEFLAKEGTWVASSPRHTEKNRMESIHSLGRNPWIPFNLTEMEEGWRPPALSRVSSDSVPDDRFRFLQAIVSRKASNPKDPYTHKINFPRILELRKADAEFFDNVRDFMLNQMPLDSLAAAQWIHSFVNPLAVEYASPPPDSTPAELQSSGRAHVHNLPTFVPFRTRILTFEMPRRWNVQVFASCCECTPMLDSHHDITNTVSTRTNSFLDCISGQLIPSLHFLVQMELGISFRISCRLIPRSFDDRQWLLHSLAQLFHTFPDSEITSQDDVIISQENAPQNSSELRTFEIIFRGEDFNHLDTALLDKRSHLSRYKLDAFLHRQKLREEAFFKRKRGKSARKKQSLEKREPPRHVLFGGDDDHSLSGSTSPFESDCDSLLPHTKFGLLSKSQEIFVINGNQYSFQVDNLRRMSSATSLWRNSAFLLYLLRDIDSFLLSLDISNIPPDMMVLHPDHFSNIAGQRIHPEESEVVEQGSRLFNLNGLDDSLFELIEYWSNSNHNSDSHSANSDRQLASDQRSKFLTSRLVVLELKRVRDEFLQSHESSDPLLDPDHSSRVLEAWREEVHRTSLVTVGKQDLSTSSKLESLNLATSRGHASDKNGPASALPPIFDSIGSPLLSIPVAFRKMQANYFMHAETNGKNVILPVRLEQYFHTHVPLVPSRICQAIFSGDANPLQLANILSFRTEVEVYFEQILRMKHRIQDCEESIKRSQHLPELLEIYERELPQETEAYDSACSACFEKLLVYGENLASFANQYNHLLNEFREHSQQPLSREESVLHRLSPTSRVLVLDALRERFQIGYQIQISCSDGLRPLYEPFFQHMLRSMLFAEDEFILSELAEVLLQSAHSTSTPYVSENEGEESREEDESTSPSYFVDPAALTEDIDDYHEAAEIHFPSPREFLG